MASANEEGDTTFKSFKELNADLTATFGDPDAVAIAQRKLYQLRKGKRDLSLYFSDFHRIIGKLKYIEQAKRDTLEHGMNEELKDAIINVFEEQSTLAKYSMLLLTINNVLKVSKEDKEGRKEM